MKRKNKTNKVDIKSVTKINNFIVRMMTGKSYKEFIEENTKGMYLFERKEFIKNLNTVLRQMAKEINKEVFSNV